MMMGERGKDDYDTRDTNRMKPGSLPRNENNLESREAKFSWELNLPKFLDVLDAIFYARDTEHSRVGV